jgi:hypothetical protein
MLSVITLSVIMLDVVMLIVGANQSGAPFWDSVLLVGSQWPCAQILESGGSE